MGISEPVLEEEGSLIAGWRAKFGEENHQVIVVGVLLVFGVIAVVVVVVVVAAVDVVVVVVIVAPRLERRTIISGRHCYHYCG